MPPHVQVDHHDDLQEASAPLSRRCKSQNDISAGDEQSPLFQDDLSILPSRRSASPLDALRNNDSTYDSTADLAQKPTKRRVSGIEAIIGSESRYAQHETVEKKTPPSPSSTAATTSTITSSKPAPTLNNGGKKVSKNKVNGVLFPKDSKQRRKEIAGFFRKGKKIAAAIVKRKSKKSL